MSTRRRPLKRRQASPGLPRRPALEFLEGRCVPSFLAARDLPVGKNPDAVVVADLTGSGVPAIVTANRDSDTVSVLSGNGDGSFQPARDYPAGRSPDSLVSGDFNGDGNTDLAVVNAVDSTVSVSFGNGDGSFRRPVVVGTTGSGLVVFLGNDDGTFQDAIYNFSTAYRATAVAVGDLNGDAIPDLVVTSANPAGPNPGQVDVLLGQAPLKNEAHSEEYRRFKGEVRVFIRCPWRLEREGQPVCASDDDAEVEVGLSKLIGERVESATAQPRSWDLVVCFSNGFSLRAFCSRAQGDPQYDDNWQIWRRDSELVVGPGDNYRKAERGISQIVG